MHQTRVQVVGPCSCLEVPTGYGDVMRAELVRPLAHQVDLAVVAVVGIEMRLHV